MAMLPVRGIRTTSQYSHMVHKRTCRKGSSSPYVLLVRSKVFNGVVEDVILRCHVADYNEVSSQSSKKRHLSYIHESSDFSENE